MTRRPKAKKEEETQGVHRQAAREALLSAVEDTGDVATPFDSRLIRLFTSSNSSVSIVPGLSSREQKALCFDSIRSFDKSCARRFFGDLRGLVLKIVQDEAFLCDEDDIKLSQATLILKIAAECVSAYVDGLPQDNSSKTLSAVNEAFDVAQLLHDKLFALNDVEDSQNAQSTILGLCETWWLSNAPRRECLVAQALPLWVLSSLSQKMDIKRLYYLRQALEVIDFDDSSSDSLRQLLLRMASSPIVLKRSEGKRLLAYIFWIDGNLMNDVHQAIRVQIPDAKQSVLQAYGEVYFRAWKEAPSDEVSVAVETQLLADLMYAVLHVAHSKTAKALLTVLEPFHDSKKNTQVEGLLFKMYGPILWRSLSAANAQVRVNASYVLAQVFPLQEPSHTQTEHAIRKACTALKALLQDRDPRCRVAGSEAMASILSTYWDVVPSDEIRILLNHIVAEHASDASSSVVRVAALDTVTTLLEVPHTHAVLRPLLPSLGNLIHDKVEKVRLAAARLLHRIKKTPGIKYYHVVPVEHLTARLADEGRHNVNGSVASELTALMLNSYFPQGPKVSVSDQIQRTLTFLSTDLAAANVFYSNVADHLPIEAVSKFAAILLRCLASAVETEEKHETKDVGNGNKRRRYGQQTEDSGIEADEEESFRLSASNTALMASLAETICTLWKSIESRLDEDVESNQFMVDSFSGTVLTRILNFFEKKALIFLKVGGNEAESKREDCCRTCAAVLRAAGWLPSKAVDGLVAHISSTLESLATENRPRQNISAHIALLCLWDMSDEVATSIASSIESAFEMDHAILFGSPSTETGKRKTLASTKKKQPLLRVPVLPPSVALEVLCDILRGVDPSSIAARETLLSSPSASYTIEKALERGTKHAECILSADSAFLQESREDKIDFVLRVCEAFGRFTLHKEATSGTTERLSSGAQRLLSWTSVHVVPALVAKYNEPFEDPNISHISVDKSLLTSPLSPILNGPTRRRANRNSTPLKLDSGLSSYSTPNKEARDEHSVLIARAFAISLMQSSCMVFAEWLAVGGCGSDEITSSVSNWCLIFDEGPQGDENHNELSSAFIRLAVQSCKSSLNFSILQKLFSSGTSTTQSGIDEDMEKALSLLFSNRSTQSEEIARKTVDCVRCASYNLIGKHNLKCNAGLPASPEDIFATVKGFIVPGLRAILANKQACSILAEQLVQDVAGSDDSPLITPQISIFAMKCLWLLCDPKASKASLEATKIVRRIDLHELDCENGVRKLAEEIMQSI